MEEEGEAKDDEKEEGGQEKHLCLNLADLAFSSQLQRSFFCCDTVQ